MNITSSTPLVNIPALPITTIQVCQVPTTFGCVTLGVALAPEEEEEEEEYVWSVISELW